MKQLVVKIVEGYAVKLLKKFKPKIIAVTGSVGKTSTKLAIATVLSQKYRVMAHYGSYNTPIAVPMAMFNIKVPTNLRNPFAWFKVFSQMRKQLHHEYPYDVLVLELGTDLPGDIAYFRKYLQPDIAVVTAVAPEHMEFFGTLDAVAKEELSIAEFSKLVMINRDDIDAQYAKFIPEGTNLDTYGTSGVAEYHFLTETVKPGEGFGGKFVSPEFGELEISLQLVGEHNIRSAVAAGAVGVRMGLKPQDIVDGMQAIVPVNGRMSLLKGLRDSLIIDDTYNASPTSVIAALQTLYLFPARQRIAILGSMNELGNYSPEAHKEVGNACDPGLLDYVITVGEEAEKYLAPAASAKGCQVRSFLSPYDAGTFAHSVLQEGAIILAKGSQNRVFTEEAIKMLLHNTHDEERLVRQTIDWLAIKERQFGKIQEIPELKGKPVLPDEQPDAKKPAGGA